MDSLIVAAIVFACTIGGAALGMMLRAVLPDTHLSSDSKDVVKMATGLIATLSALVLGLLVASAKGTFDAQKTGFQQIAANFVLLDRTLAQFGPDAKHARELLRRTVSTLIDRLWPADGSKAAGLDAMEITELGGELLSAIQNLSPTTDLQKSLQSQALQIGAEMARTRWHLSQQEDGSIPTPFLVVLVFWLFVLFTSFGLLSPRNATVSTDALLVECAFVAAHLFLIVDLGQPFQGVSAYPVLHFARRAKAAWTVAKYQEKLARL